jgi:hypothetical protein
MLEAGQGSGIFFFAKPSNCGYFGLTGKILSSSLVHDIFKLNFLRINKPQKIE